MAYGNPTMRIPFDVPDGTKSVQEFVNDGIASYLFAESPSGERAIVAQFMGENNGTQTLKVRLSGLVNALCRCDGAVWEKIAGSDTCP